MIIRCFLNLKDEKKPDSHNIFNSAKFLTLKFNSLSIKHDFKKIIIKPDFVPTIFNRAKFLT